MIDPQWVRILARSRYIDGRWETNDPKDCDALYQGQRRDFIAQLRSEVERVTDVYNSYTEHSQFRVVEIDQAQSGGEGFAILFGKTQITVRSSLEGVDFDITRLLGFESKTQTLYRLSPQRDSFGGVSWVLDNDLPIEIDQIIKKLVEGLARHAATQR